MRPPAVPAAAGQPRSYKPAPLRLDAEGREVDEHGVPVVRKQAVTELKVPIATTTLKLEYMYTVVVCTQECCCSLGCSYLPVLLCFLAQLANAGMVCVRQD